MHHSLRHRRARTPFSTRATRLRSQFFSAGSTQALGELGCEGASKSANLGRETWPGWVVLCVTTAGREMGTASGEKKKGGGGLSTRLGWKGEGGGVVMVEGGEGVGRERGRKGEVSGYISDIDAILRSACYPAMDLGSFPCFYDVSPPVSEMGELGGGLHPPTTTYWGLGYRRATVGRYKFPSLPWHMHASQLDRSIGLSDVCIHTHQSINLHYISPFPHTPAHFPCTLLPHLLTTSPSTTNTVLTSPPPSPLPRRNISPPGVLPCNLPTPSLDPADLRE